MILPVFLLPVKTIEAEIDARVPAVGQRGFHAGIIIAGAEIQEGYLSALAAERFRFALSACF